jgi:thioesterase domain-containing protein
MNASELQAYLLESIPLARAMQIEVVEVSDAAVTVRAPIEPNINQHNTVFGGSAAALSFLAGWSLVHVRLLQEGIRSHVVLRSSRIDYEAPMTGSFSARAQLAEGADWAHFTSTLARRGRARIAIAAILESEGRVGARMSGEFAALG